MNALRIFFAATASLLAQDAYDLTSSQAFLDLYCKACHQPSMASGGFQTAQLAAKESLLAESRRWSRVITRTANREMPPRGAPVPPSADIDRFTKWADSALRAAACSAGTVPGPAVSRRLNKDEYTATLRDLLDMQMDIGAALPADGAGGEGFDNAAETLFLTPLLTEKYMELAKFAMDYAAREYKSRDKIFIAKPGPGVTEEQAARKIIDRFLPRAFRRPVTAGEGGPYLALFASARRNGADFEPAVLFALRAALVSPNFLFRIEPPNTSSQIKPVDSYTLASRLSYFLWGSMPDELLFDLAGTGKLNNPAVLRQMIPRMLRNDRAEIFAKRFIEQWTGTRELTATKSPDAKLFTGFEEEEIRSDIRLQPVYFLRAILARDRPVTDLLDSTHTIGTSNLEKLYNIKLPLDPGRRKQPQWVELPKDSRRGGLLGMAAVHAVSSYPYRTSPVLRGAWVLDAILGTPPPPPPPDVPELKEAHAEEPKTMRDRLMQHRANPVCASCHDQMDPLGFALENYDVVGRWRDAENGKPIDASGQLPDGSRFQGPDQLRRLLMERKDVFLRNLANKMLGYALGRGLTLKDSCAVDVIVNRVRAENYRSHALIEAIVTSVPFLYQSGSIEHRRP